MKEVLSSNAEECEEFNAHLDELVTGAQRNNPPGTKQGGSKANYLRKSDNQLLLELRLVTA